MLYLQLCFFCFDKLKSQPFIEHQYLQTKICLEYRELKRVKYQMLEEILWRFFLFFLSDISRFQSEEGTLIHLFFLSMTVQCLIYFGLYF